MKLLLLFLSALVVLQPTCAFRIGGNVVTSNDFTYLGKFAFGQHGGNLSIWTAALDPISQSINASSNIYGQKLALFPDLAGEWETIEDSQLSCADKLALAGKTVYNIGTINTGWDHGYGRLNLAVSGRRPHWWYVVLANCQPDDVINATSPQAIDSSTGLPVVVSVAYDLKFTNGGSVWTNELSWDQQHISEIAITFLIAYVLIFAALMITIVRSIKQSGSANNATMFIVLSIIVFCQILAQILTIGYQVEMMHKEVIKPPIEHASWWFDTFSQLGLLASVMMWASKNVMDRSTKITIASIMMVYLFGYLASFVVNVRFEQDHPSLNEWMFNNWGGYILCACRLLNIAVVIHMCVQSMHQAMQQTTSQSSPRSVLAYTLFVAAWLASFPLITLIASMTVSYWRAKFFYGVNCVVAFVMITAQIGVTYRHHMLSRAEHFKTMESSKVQGEVSMSDMNRSPNNSNPSSPRSPQSPSQAQFRSVAPV